MKVTVEMGAEEFMQFMKFSDEYPKMQSMAGKQRAAIRELATAVDAALTETADGITVDGALARAALRLAGQYL